MLARTHGPVLLSLKSRQRGLNVWTVTTWNKYDFLSILNKSTKIFLWK